MIHENLLLMLTLKVGLWPDLIFYDLVKINGNAVATADQMDTSSGLDKSKFDMTNLTMACKTVTVSSVPGLIMI